MKKGLWALFQWHYFCTMLCHNFTQNSFVRKQFTKYILLLLAVLPVAGLRAQGPQNSLLWEVTGNGLKKPSYVYGTIHIPDKRVFAFNDSVLPKLQHSDAFASEIALTPANEARMAKASILDNGKKLKDFFTQKEYQKLTDYLKRNGYDIEQLQQFKPFVGISLVSRGQVKSDMPYVVDEYLSGKAKESGKELLGIEDVEEQLALIDKLPVSEMIASIDDTSDAAEAKEMDEMVMAYANADLDKLQQLIMKFEVEEKMMGKQLLTDRNYTMADRMAVMFKKQSVFAAIGAGHLPGKEGVLQLLRNKGYTVKPIIAGHTPDQTVADAPPAISYTLDNGDFVAKFSGVPDTSSQSLSTEAGMVKVNNYILETKGDNVVFAVSYTDYPKEKEPHSESEINAMLDGAAAGSVSKMVGSTIKSTSRIEMDGIPGMDVVVDYMGGAAIIHMKYYLQHNRLFVVQVINSANEDNDAEMNRFFESFKVKTKR